MPVRRGLAQTGLRLRVRLRLRVAWPRTRGSGIDWRLQQRRHRERDCSAPRGAVLCQPRAQHSAALGGRNSLQTKAPTGRPESTTGLRPPRWGCVKELLVQGLGETVSIGVYSNVAIAGVTDRNRPVGTGTTRRGHLLILNHNLTLNPNLLRLVPVRRRLAQTGLRL
ncbi:hypothetical protein Pla52o_51130 [Novipirellula galeiformis]|uniref:Uncharacterized protein n=1 Tax=Novipirellula galeiformis TaxID=2528004 RepID=A0A5C6C0R1_9BACT|nr:hypothetical protein Pla52o_51130 [Novipirellula galeiformis]